MVIRLFLTSKVLILLGMGLPRKRATSIDDNARHYLVIHLSIKCLTFSEEQVFLIMFLFTMKANGRGATLNRNLI